MLLGIDASRANREKKTGVEWYAWQVIQELKKIIPPETEVVLYSERPLVGPLAELPAHWRSRVLNWPPRFLWTQLRLSWEMLWHAPDVLFVPAHVAPIISPRRLAVTIHDVAFRAQPAAYSFKGRFYLNFFNWLDSYRAKKVLTISQYSRQEIEKYYPAAKNKLVVAPLAADLDRYRPLMDQAKTQAILAKHHLPLPFFLSVGRLEVKKNTHGLIRAFAQAELPAHQLVLVGQPGRWYNRVAAVLAGCPAAVRARIILPGWVGEEEIVYLMNAATALVLPSLYEGFGIPILEAMACGCPVITANTTACPETAGEAAILIDPADDEQLTAALERLAGNSAERQRLVIKGQLRARQFSWATTAAATWAALRGL